MTTRQWALTIVVGGGGLPTAPVTNNIFPQSTLIPLDRKVRRSGCLCLYVFFFSLVTSIINAKLEEHISYSDADMRSTETDLN